MSKKHVGYYISEERGGVNPYPPLSEKSQASDPVPPRKPIVAGDTLWYSSITLDGALWVEPVLAVAPVGSSAWRCSASASDHYVVRLTGRLHATEKDARRAAALSYLEVLDTQVTHLTERIKQDHATLAHLQEQRIRFQAVLEEK